jgi:hypothetical protein
VERFAMAPYPTPNPAPASRRGAGQRM